jgi:uncharacterized membrane protein
MKNGARSLVTLCSAVFFGAALYISSVQHPAALEAGHEIYLRYFPVMYRRAAVLQGGTAVLGFLAGIVAWRTSGTRLWLVAAILLGSAVPLTLLMIKPVNDVLMSPDASRSADVGALFARWGRLHLIRTIASGMALLCCLAGLLRRAPSSGTAPTRTDRA